MRTDTPIFQSLPADAPCVLVYDPSGKIPAWIRWGAFRPGFASIPHYLTGRGPCACRGFFASIDDAIAAARAAGYAPTHYALIQEGVQCPPLVAIDG